ncbi:MAG: hypothetical protein JXJ22_11015 [Bacteroidales bacterium]|nr:hypothetical protein [Bacteroidales bacterium]
MGLLRTLLIIFLIYYIGRLFARYIMPFLLRNYIKNQMGNTSSQYQNRNQSKREGQVTVDYQPKKEKQIKKDKGDYIDYEEVSK